MTQRRVPPATNRGGLLLAFPLGSTGWTAWRPALRRSLADSINDGFAEDVLIVAGELVANAVEHGIPPAMLEVALEPDDTVLVSVLDAGPVVPLTAVHPPPGAARGRGLAIVESLAPDWGVSATDTGKSVWARVTKPTEHGS